MCRDELIHHVPVGSNHLYVEGSLWEGSHPETNPLELLLLLCDDLGFVFGDGGGLVACVAVMMLN